MGGWKLGEMKNEILEEVWRVRDAFAKRHHYDLDSMVAELRKMERKPLGPIVSREKKTVKKRGAARNGP
jgi:hypothetical protein